MRATASDAKFTPSDRVIYLEWFGDHPLPAPRCHGKRAEFSVIEREYLTRCLTRSQTRVKEGGRPRDTGFADERRQGGR